MVVLTICFHAFMLSFLGIPFTLLFLFWRNTRTRPGGEGIFALWVSQV